MNDRVPAYLHNRPALDHFWAIRPDSHLTISIFAWYLPLKDWNLYYVFAHLLAIWPFLSLFDPTRTRPFAICIDLYSTNLVSVHSLHICNCLFRFRKRKWKSFLKIFFKSVEKNRWSHNYLSANFQAFLYHCMSTFNIQKIMMRNFTTLIWHMNFWMDTISRGRTNQPK